MSWTLALVALLACSGGDDAADQAAAPAPAKATPAEDAKPEPSVDEARRLAGAGQHAEALAMAESLVAGAPDNAGIWRLMLQESVRGGVADELFDRLDAVEAIGGQVVYHHTLRHELALATGKYDAALAAGKLVRAQDADAGVAMMAAALLAGAAIPPELLAPADGQAADGEGAATEPAAGDALLRLALAQTPAEAEAQSEQAATVMGWRAAMIRARVAAKSGAHARALAEYGAAAASDDVLGKTRADLARAEYSLANRDLLAEGWPEDAGDPPTLVQAGAWAEEAGRALADEGDGTGAADALGISVGAYLMALDVEKAKKVADDLHSSRSEAGDALVAARTGAIAGLVSLTVGDLSEAENRARAASIALAEAGDGEAAARAAWTEGWAAYGNGRADAVRGAAERATGPHRAALEALAALQSEDLAGAIAKLPAEGLEGRDLTYLALEASVFDSANAVQWADKAVAAADATGDRMLAIRARLAREELARRVGDKAGTRMRSELAALAPEGPAGDALRAEVAARTLLAGGSATFPATEGQPAVIGVWSAIGSSTAAGDVGDDPWASALAAWSKARAAARSGDAEGVEGAYSLAVSTIPVHRVGTLALGTVLDGSSGMPIGADLDVLAKLKGAGPLAAGLYALDSQQQADGLRSDVSQGRDLTWGLSEEHRAALLGATARARASVQLWLAGAGPYPVEALKALDEAEKAAGEDFALKVLLPVPPRPFGDLIQDLGGVAVVSLADVSGTFYGIVAKKEGGAIRQLGPSASIFELANEHRQGLVRAAMDSEAQASHVAANKLRVALVDPFSTELTGIGRYLVVAPSGLLNVPFSSLPEQESGLRWLADIRTIGTIPSLRAASPTTDKLDRFETDYLAFTTPRELGEEERAAAVEALKKEADLKAKAAAKAKAKVGASEETVAPVAETEDPEVRIPHEINDSKRQFMGGVPLIHSGMHATVENWKLRAPKARVIHLNGLQAGARGGLQLSDGELTPSLIRGTPIAAEVVVITVPASETQLRVWVRAFLEAGARAVVVGEWEIPEAAQQRYLNFFYEALNRDRTASRALQEARELVLRDELEGVDVADPAVWGSLMFVGLP